MTIPRINELIQKLESAIHEGNKKLDADFGRLMKTYMIPELIAVAKSANLPQGFIDGIGYIQDGPATGKIINTWGSKDKPLARWFNFGTPRHWIQPKNPKGVLAWKSEGPESGHAQAIYSKRADNEKGGMLFSKGHYVTGLPATQAMEIGIRLGKERMREIGHELSG